MSMLYSIKTQQNSSIICYFFVTRPTWEKTAGFIPPFEIDIKLVLHTASTDFINTEELLEEVDKLEEEAG